MDIIIDQNLFIYHHSYFVVMSQMMDKDDRVGMEQPD